MYDFLVNGKKPPEAENEGQSNGTQESDKDTKTGT